MHLIEGGAIVLENFQVISRSIIAYVSKFAHDLMNVVEHLCWECRVKHKLLWKNLSKRVGADGVSQPHKRTG